MGRSQVGEVRTTTVLGFLFVALTACPYGGPKGDVSQNAPAQTTTTTSSAAEVMTNVELSEYAIHIPPTLTAGQQRFHIVNTGKEKHNFVITGNGVSAQLPDDLMRGDATEIGIVLKPGTYTVFCPVDGHRGKGMETTVTVK